jgi:hypothetical protein
MSSDDKRTALLHEIEAWREAWAASVPGSPQHREFQNKMKSAEWKLKALGPPQHPRTVLRVRCDKRHPFGLGHLRSRTAYSFRTSLDCGLTLPCPHSVKMGRRPQHMAPGMLRPFCLDAGPKPRAQLSLFDKSSALWGRRHSWKT